MIMGFIVICRNETTDDIGYFYLSLSVSVSFSLSVITPQGLG